MDDISSRLSSSLEASMQGALGSAVGLTGVVDNVSQQRLTAAATSLSSSLSRYSRVAETHSASSTDEEQLQKIIQEEVPDSYRNHKYKQLFWRMVYTMVPFMRRKKQTEDQINFISREALAVFEVIFTSLADSAKELNQYAESKGDEYAADAEEFDPEFGYAISALESETKPQQAAGANAKKKPEAADTASKTPEEFQDFLRQHKGKITASEESISASTKELTHLLQNSTARAFSLIHDSAIRSGHLGQVLNAASVAARKSLQPGTYVACKALLAAIIATNTVITTSVALNTAQRIKVNKNLKALEQGMKKQVPASAKQPSSVPQRAAKTILRKSH